MKQQQSNYLVNCFLITVFNIVLPDTYTCN